MHTSTAAHCSRTLPSGVTAARCRRRSLPTKGSPDVAARLRAASRLRVEAELSRDAWTRAAARRWREQQRQRLARPHKTPVQEVVFPHKAGFVSVAVWYHGNYFLSQKCPLEGEHSSLCAPHVDPRQHHLTCTHHRLPPASPAARLPPPPSCHDLAVVPCSCLAQTPPAHKCLPLSCLLGLLHACAPGLPLCCAVH